MTTTVNFCYIGLVATPFRVTATRLESFDTRTSSVVGGRFLRPKKTAVGSAAAVPGDNCVPIRLTLL